MFNHMPLCQNFIVDELEWNPNAVPINSLSHEINEKRHSFIKTLTLRIFLGMDEALKADHHIFFKG